MNEIFAQEVKEEVLRSIGRVRSQIDPPPPLGLNPRVRWKKDPKDKVPTSVYMPSKEFAAAILTYTEQREAKKI